MNSEKENKDVIDVTVDEEYDENGNSVKDKKEERREQRSEARKESRNLNKDWEEFKDKMNDIGQKLNDFTDAFSSGFREGYNSAAKWNKTKNESPLTQKILKILPFMDEEDIHEMVDKIIAKDPDFDDVNVVALMPFLEDADCDKLFVFKLSENQEVPMDAVSFVSEDCLSFLVDEYISGKYPDLDVDKLYPYLDGDDVKKLFYFELKKNKKKPADSQQ